MADLFLFLMLVSFVSLIVALINPSLFQKIFKDKATRKKLSIYFGSATFLFFILVGITADPVQKNTNNSTKNEEKIVVVFDLETLYGKNIDQIRTVLGKPTDDKQTDPTTLQVNMGVNEWNNTFKKDKYELLVTYNVTTRKIIDFFINNPELTKDIEKLKKTLNIQISSNFTIEPVKTIKDPSSYTGIKVIPKK